MVATDLDQDGDQDFLIALGDNLELINNAAQPWHGVKWLENKGDWKECREGEEEKDKEECGREEKRKEGDRLAA